jgi:hypothetical protein
MIRKRMISISNVINLVDDNSDVPVIVTSPDGSGYPFALTIYFFNSQTTLALKIGTNSRISFEKILVQIL